MCLFIKEVIYKNYNFFNKLLPILQYQKNNKFLHNLNYVNDKNMHYSTNTFEGYLNCGATCYILDYFFKINGINAKMVKTKTTKNFRPFDHVFLVKDNLIIDPTYRQLFRDDYILNNDKFMNKIYNSDDFYFLDSKKNLEKLIKKYNANYKKEYNSLPFNIIEHYENYSDISYLSDLDLVVKSKQYAKKKGECFLNLNIYINNYI